MVFQNLAVCKCDLCIAAIYIMLRLWTAERDKYAIYSYHFITARLKNCIICTTAALPSLPCYVITRFHWQNSEQRLQIKLNPLNGNIFCVFSLSKEAER